MLAKVLTAGAAAAAAVAALATPAHAAGQVCASAYVQVNDQVLVDQSNCVDLP